MAPPCPLNDPPLILMVHSGDNPSDSSNEHDIK